MRSFKWISSTCEITNVASLLDAIKEFINGGDPRVYLRGVGDTTYSPLPSIGRKHHYIGRPYTFTRLNERQMLSRFRRHAFAQWNRIPTEWEALFLARHHGLPVRLLDWTSNPLVALYFTSTFEKDPKDGAIWAVQRRRDEDHDLRILDGVVRPLDVPGIKLVYPFYPTPRMTVQSGLFTIQEDPWQPLENFAGHSYRDEDLDIERMTKWSIPKDAKAKIVCELERLGINSRTLFPDLDGISKGLWHSVIVREVV